MIQSAIQIAKQLAPEDIQVGDYVALLEITYQYPSFSWDADPVTLPPHEPICIKWESHAGGFPSKVKAVCLPFVLLRSATGEIFSLDVRHARLARVDCKYARVAWRAFKRKRRKRKKRPGH